MSKLGKLGSFFLKIGTVAPLVLRFTPLAPIADEVEAAIKEAEAIKGASGEQKLAHVLAIVQDAAKAANDKAGRIVVDPSKINESAASLISAIVDLADLIQHPAGN